MQLETRTKHFVSRGTAIHNGKFNYSLSNYINAKTPIKIICPTHGEFMQTPDKHLAPKSKGCPACWQEIKSLLQKTRDYSKMKKKECYSSEQFIALAHKRFNNKFKYNLLNYQGITKGLIKVICSTHGEFTTTARKHLTSHTGCPACGIIQSKNSRCDSYDFILRQLQTKHKFCYDYPESNRATYHNKKSIIDIICQKHGMFKKQTQKHLVGQGCFPCKVEEMIEQNILVGGYSEDLFRDKPELKKLPAVLYYLKINNGQYYKVGISRAILARRIQGIISKAKKFNTIITIEIIKTSNKTLHQCFRAEQEILKSNPRCYTKWSTELFDHDILPNITRYFLE